MTPEQLAALLTAADLTLRSIRGNIAIVTENPAADIARLFTTLLDKPTEAGALATLIQKAEFKRTAPYVDEYRIIFDMAWSEARTPRTFALWNEPVPPQ